MITRSRMKHKQKGLTIAELMVDVLLSAFVMGILISFYIAYKRNDTIQYDNLLISSNATAAYNVINSDLQLIGFYGCGSDASSIEYAMTPSFDYELDNPISGFEATSTGLNSTFNISSPSIGYSPALQGQISDVSPDDGSDALTVRFADTNPTAILQTATTGSSLVIGDQQYAIAEGDILLISDCTRTVVFEVGSVTGSTITPTESVGSLSALAEIYKINVNSYYVKTVDGLSSLYKYSENTETLLVPNVENMQILYGQDTTSNNIVDKFYTANNLEDKPIKTVEIGFMLKSDNKHKQMQINNQYYLLQSPAPINTTITINTPTDYYFRRTYDFYITLENA